MVTHTILFAFPDDMSPTDRDEFFREGTQMALDSGLVLSYRHQPSIPLVSGVQPVFVPSAMAQIQHADLDSLQRYLTHPQVAEFVRRWQARFPYRAVSVNTEDLPIPTSAP
ncbi:antibiotic biosynthesis monooxygenase family protein [Micromonospora rifamycinica]|uniref:Uncharacterized protein n=1 Tax=Micromonospora rifamycinica TaxID=291594 RepID=A0A109IP18_9ACTN|nr:hypothetical protein [Micromonospora rifamycinica]KWV34059.1 hypothetical protein AWV63_03960 [Micromonospora rifamycinica]SCG47153.1 hypothetical protein GA0070623_1439 [Micromonospora rifamycinica]